MSALAQYPPLRCLWISRDLPFPLDAGDKIYSAQLARSLAQSGAHVRFLASANDDGPAAPRDWPVDWQVVEHRKRRPVSALFSMLPSVAAVHATAAYRDVLRRQLAERWDAIIIDSYGSGWALNACLTAARRGNDMRPTLVYVSHNHEEQLWRSMARDARGSMLRRAVLWQNYRKVRRLERTLLHNVDLVTTITAEDADAYAAIAPGVESVVLTPGYSGTAAEPRSITSSTPRRVAIVGSFRWVIKQENLRRFVTAADHLFAQHGITLDVIGDVPTELRDSLGRLEATTFHGFVDDPSQLLRQARLAVVPELIGGGFKLKFLDYIFARVPVATLGQATSGLPIELRREMLTCDTLETLLHAIVSQIDALATLDGMQQRAFEIARVRYRWEDRGRQLQQAIGKQRFASLRPVRNHAMATSIDQPTSP